MPDGFSIASNATNLVLRTPDSRELLAGIPYEYKPGPWYTTQGMVDWREWQWRASFKGVPFAVDEDIRSGGRRIHIHEYPGREHWDNEDLGRLRQTFDVEAFVFGDQQDMWAEVLFGYCTDIKVGTLVLPMRVPTPARCISVQSTFRANQLGRIDFSMRFVLEPYFGNPNKRGLLVSQIKSPVAMVGLVSAAAKRLINAARYVFETGFAGDYPASTREQAGVMMNRARFKMTDASKAARIRSLQQSHISFISTYMGTVISDLANATRTNSNVLTQTTSIASQTSSAVASTGASAAGLNPTAQVGSALRASTGQVIPQIPGVNEGFGGLFQRALEFMQEGAPAPGDLLQALQDLSALEVTATQVTSAQAASDSIALAVGVAFFVRRLSLAHSCLASCRIAPERMNETLKMRKRVIARLDAELELASNHGIVYQAMRDLRMAIMRFTDYWSTGGGATKTVRVRGGRPISAVVGTHYPGDRDRDIEIMRINDIHHPFDVPERISIIDNGGSTGGSSSGTGSGSTGSVGGDRPDDGGGSGGFGGGSSGGGYGGSSG